MKCVSCGSENYPSARFCQMCGQPLPMVSVEGAAGVWRDQAPHQVSTLDESSSGVVSKKTEIFLWRTFGGISWLLVSIGPFLVGFGVLGMFSTSDLYYESPVDDFRMIGYGIVVFAIAAIFVALNRLVKGR